MDENNAFTRTKTLQWWWRWSCLPSVIAKDLWDDIPRETLIMINFDPQALVCRFRVFVSYRHRRRRRAHCR